MGADQLPDALQYTLEAPIKWYPVSHENETLELSFLDVESNWRAWVFSIVGQSTPAIRSQLRRQ